MKQLPYCNDQPHAVFVGAVMIPPGHTRLVDAALLPQPEAEPAPPSQPVDPLVELLKGNVAQVVDAIPGLSIEDLTRLGDLEQIGGQRKGVLGAIAARLLDESSQQQDGGLQQPNQPPAVEEAPKQDAEKDSEHPKQDTEQEQVAE